MAKKFYVSNFDDLNEYEKEHNRISYGRLCDRVFNSMILCNNILQVDEDCINNLICGDFYDYKDEDGNYYSREEYESDSDGKIYEEPKEFYQYYIVTIGFTEDYIQEHFGDELTLLYSDKLDNYILCVDHFGTGWGYVLTGLEPTTDFDAIYNS